MSINITSIIKKLIVLFLVIGGLILAKGFLMPIVIGGNIGYAIFTIFKLFGTP